MAKHCTFVTSTGEHSGEVCLKPREVRLVVKKPGRRRVNEDYCQSHASYRKWQYRGTYCKVVKQIDLTFKVPKPAALAQTSLNLEV